MIEIKEQEYNATHFNSPEKKEEFWKKHIAEYITESPDLKWLSYAEYQQQNLMLVESLSLALQSNIAKNAGKVCIALKTAAYNGFEVLLNNMFFKIEPNGINKYHLLKSYLGEQERKELFLDLAISALKSSNNKLITLIFDNLFSDLKESTTNRDHKFIEEFIAKYKNELLTCTDENFAIAIKHISYIPISYQDLQNLLVNKKIQRAQGLITKLDDTAKKDLLKNAMVNKDLSTLTFLLSHFSNVYSTEVLIEGLMQHGESTVFEHIIDSAFLSLTAMTTILLRSGNCSASLLHTAVAHNQLGISKSLLEKYHFDINILNHERCTPLHIACLKATEDQGMVTFLLEAGANVNSSDKEGRTPYDIAMYTSNLKLVKLLQKYMANPHKQAEEMLDVNEEIAKEVKTYTDQYELRTEFFKLTKTFNHEIKELKSQLASVKQENSSLKQQLDTLTKELRMKEKIEIPTKKSSANNDFKNIEDESKSSNNRFKFL